MKKLFTLKTLLLAVATQSLTSCDDGNNSFPDKYIGFADKSQELTYSKNDKETEFQVKIIAVDKSKEDRIVTIESPYRPANGAKQFFKIKDSTVTIKAGSKSGKATLILYPKEIGISKYIQLICRPQDKKSEASKLLIGLVKK